MSAGIYTSAAAIRASGREALSIHQAKTPKYHLRAGGQYLHFSGGFLTQSRTWAWMGTIEQARACRRKFDAAAGCKIAAIQSVPVHVEEVQ